MPELSSDERTRRRRAVDAARTNVELSGASLDPGSDALNERYVAGDLSQSEHIEALLAHARTLPPGVPVQQYFASFEEAMTAARP